MPTDPATKVSVSSFQQCDGTNFTTAGVDNSYKTGNCSIGVYTGIGLTFDGKNSSAVLDLKGSVPYGESPVSGGFRIRNNLSENSQTVQMRIQPCTVNIPVGEKTTLYAAPYSAVKINYKNGDTKTNFGGFAGVSQKIGKNASIFVEGQIYDVTKTDKNTTSVNAGISVTL